jgi:hypothetical protein
MNKSRFFHMSAFVATTAIILPLAIATVARATPGRALVAPAGKLLAELKGSDAIAGDAVGVSVAVSGTVAVVGAPGYAKDAGRVYVFTRTAKGWKQTAELKGSDTAAGNFFGYSVAISGSTFVVGAPAVAKNSGRAYVFEKASTRWRQTAELKGSDIASSDYLGDAVAISATTAIVGADGYAKNTGRAYVFEKSASGWAQTAELKGSDSAAQDGFGYSVGVSGTLAVVGAPDHAKNAGRAYFFSDSGSGWRQTAELKGSDTISDNGFGVAVGISGQTAIVGAPGFSKAAGRSYLFTVSGGSWKQAAELKGSDTVSSDDFGYSVALSGDTAVAGSPGFSKTAGRSYVFTDAGSSWKQSAELKGPDTVAADYFGYSVAVSQSTALIGADGHAKSTGRAYAFAA